ncbi:hypothetical protein L202_00051 [Cryptococcus amylolentus CBS 6039]|uniref:Uncharacterized protein n=1 Tax=Cryptococcus amylolentus CBS 6039 TaxID=1295533 RepID=A0A1E3I5Y8_9TREE|nr:hypothetical protein L202_00051 [Cryptococcus amylolentus CBS 6039]ODN84019.1 hypothetical protein L202_00051 [Cryptococcus amylolentus CBS 6039]
MASLPHVSTQMPPLLAYADFAPNREALGITRITYNQFATITLDFEASHPRTHAFENGLVPPGFPCAFLKQLEICFSWFGEWSTSGAEGQNAWREGVNEGVLEMLRQKLVVRIDISQAVDARLAPHQPLFDMFAEFYQISLGNQRKNPKKPIALAVEYHKSLAE